VKYRYAGPGPVEDPDDHAVVHPGDVREMESCDWGPWELVPEDGGAEAPAAVPAAPAPAPAPETTPAASTASGTSKEA
jgi:hypothetical protein